MYGGNGGTFTGGIIFYKSDTLVNYFLILISYFYIIDYDKCVGGIAYPVNDVSYNVIAVDIVNGQNCTGKFIFSIFLKIVIISFLFIIIYCFS